MFLIQAPYPLFKTTCLLPSPEPGNSQGLQSTVQTMRAVDGTLYTFIKKKRGRKAVSWDFLVAVDKANEVKEFVRLYAGSVVRTTDHNGVQQLGTLTINPLELAGDGRAVGWPGGEASRLTLNLDELV